MGSHIKVTKTALRIKSNSKYNTHIEPLFKELRLLKVNDIFDVQCLKFWYKFVNKKLPNYFKDMFQYNYELHDIVTRNHDRLHLYPTRTSGANNVLRHHIPELLNEYPGYLINRIKTHSLHSISDLFIIGCRRTDNIGSGRWFGRWFPRYSNDTNGLITPRKLCSPCYISLYQLIFWWMYRYWLQWPHRYQSEWL